MVVYAFKSVCIMSYSIEKRRVICRTLLKCDLLNTGNNSIFDDLKNSISTRTDKNLLSVLIFWSIWISLLLIRYQNSSQVQNQPIFGCHVIHYLSRHQFCLNSLKVQYTLHFLARFDYERRKHLISLGEFISWFWFAYINKNLLT